MAQRYKRPESVLVVVHTARTVLLLRRRQPPGFWQSVTGSLDWTESSARAAAVRELREETGLAVGAEALRDLGLVHRYPILPEWRARFAPDVDSNTEYAFALALPDEPSIRLSPEHDDCGWFDFQQASAQASSWTNRDAIEAVAATIRG